MDIEKGQKKVMLQFLFNQTEVVLAGTDKRKTLIGST